jgi:hypothetical protein
MWILGHVWLRRSSKPLIKHSAIVGRKLLLPSSAFNRREERNAMSQMPGLDGDGAVLGFLSRVLCVEMHELWCRY